MDEFDAYLAAKDPPKAAAGGDEFDTYLASKGHPISPAAFRNAARSIDVGPVKPPRSLLQRLGDSVAADLKTIGTGAATVINSVQHPIDTIRDPHKRREFERGLDDMLTMGAGQRLAARIGNALGDKPDVAIGPETFGGGISGGGGQPVRNTQDVDERAAPGYRAAGNLVGIFTPGAANAAGKLGSKVAGKALSRLPVSGPLSGAAGGTARAVLGYEAAAVPTAAAQAAVAGENPIEAARRAATNPLGLIASAVVGAGAGGARGYSAKLRDPKTLEGRTVRDVEAAGGEIRPFGDPARGGLYESPELAGLPKGRAGMNELAGKSQEAIKEYNRAKLADAREQYGTELDDILAEHADKSHLAEQTHDTLDALEKRATLSNGKVANKKLHGVVQEVRDLLTTDTGRLDQRVSQASGKPVYVSAPAVKVEDMIKVKQAVNDLAEWGSPATADNAPYRLIHHALVEDAASVDPRIKELNRTYGQTMEGIKAANDILFGQKKTDVADSAPKSKSAALKLGRVGDETQAATTDRLGELEKLDPEYGRQLRLLKAKKAAERLRYGEPEVSTSIEKGVKRGAAHAVLPAIGGAIGLSHGPIGAAAGAAAGAALENPFALKLRLGLPVAEYAGRAQGLGAGLLADRIRAAREYQKRLSEQRAALLAGHLGGAVAP